MMIDACSFHGLSKGAWAFLHRYEVFLCVEETRRIYYDGTSEVVESRPILEQLYKRTVYAQFYSEYEVRRLGGGRRETRSVYKRCQDLFQFQCEDGSVYGEVLQEIRDVILEEDGRQSIHRHCFVALQDITRKLIEESLWTAKEMRMDINRSKRKAQKVVEIKKNVKVG